MLAGGPGALDWLGPPLSASLLVQVSAGSLPASMLAPTPAVLAQSTSPALPVSGSGPGSGLAAGSFCVEGSVARRAAPLAVMSPGVGWPLGSGASRCRGRGC